MNPYFLDGGVALSGWTERPCTPRVTPLFTRATAVACWSRPPSADRRDPRFRPSPLPTPSSRRNQSRLIPPGHQPATVVARVPPGWAHKPWGLGECPRGRCPGQWCRSAVGAPRAVCAAPTLFSERLPAACSAVSLFPSLPTLTTSRLGCCPGLLTCPPLPAPSLPASVNPTHCWSDLTS